MSRYTVKPGDCLTQIADEHGFADYRDIYDHPANAGFRRLRPNPHVIQTGDEIFIPPLATEVHSLQTGASHRITVKRPAARIAVFVKDADGEPLSKRPFVLTIDGGKPTKGTTSADGLVEASVSPTAKTGVLDFPKDRVSFTLRLGHLDPLSTDAGLVTRLENLGLLSATGTTASEDTAWALSRFQAEQGLEATGTLDAATVDRLCHLHDHDKQS